jgi:hypothetical protein
LPDLFYYRHLGSQKNPIKLSKRPGSCSKEELAREMRKAPQRETLAGRDRDATGGAATRFLAIFVAGRL